MAVAVVGSTHRAAINDGTNATSYAFSAVAFGATGRLILVIGQHEVATTAADLSSITGSNVTGMTKVCSTGVNGRTDTMISVWAGTSASTSSAAVTVNIGTTATGATFGLYELTGVNTALGNTGVYTFTAGGGTSTTNQSVTLAGSFLDSDDATIAVYANAAATTYTAKGGWTELTDSAGSSPNRATQMQFIASNDASSTATASSAAAYGALVFAIAETNTTGAQSIGESPATVTVTPVALGITPGGVSVAESPASVTVTPVALGITPGGASPAESPATVTVTPQALGVSPGAVSLALSPATITVTPVAPDISAGGSDTNLALSPATITVTPVALEVTLDAAPEPEPDEPAVTGAGGKYDIRSQTRQAWRAEREQAELEDLLAREDEELLVLL